ncbi:hypothetical protein VSX64_03620 [Aurantimonas sp. C2-6-R+9]|uniref:hypothetical protein n=1 Tax=unclassified Aurantimonas TaxID=2638230 RepID=UPI002E17651A|nr:MULTISPECIES: hypothetical protein [unclassified Aurantimonas]MEC5289882.1 hypothetical protein [Aurantimonas sp. C2-3-R2]MEC5379977.1 hypothetical protein [Aurantimonas sp. C2-6-R+9]MEC5410964.1 hypothetical protein [Aurantimonas sp. C2-4-R8]
MTDPALIGALVGLAIGLADFFVLGYVIDAMARRRPSERVGAGAALNIARVSQFVLFPVVGWFAGPVIASNLGG